MSDWAGRAAKAILHEFPDLMRVDTLGMSIDLASLLRVAGGGPTPILDFQSASELALNFLDRTTEFLKPDRHAALALILSGAIVVAGSIGPAGGTDV